jgi:hypothetical protein
MKRTLCLLVVLSFYSLHAQKTSQNKLSIGFNFSPDYSYRGLHNKSGSEYLDQVIKARNDKEVAKFGYTTGFNICFAPSGRIAFETGIQYSGKGYQVKKYELIYGGPDPTAPVTAQSIYSYQYIGIPFRAKLFLGNGDIRVPIQKRTPGKDKLRFLLSAGFMTNFLVNTRQVLLLEYADGRTDEHKVNATGDFNKIDISPMISAGFDYTVNKKVRLAIEPTFRYGMISTKDATIKEHLWSTGLNIGIYYSLR